MEKKRLVGVLAKRWSKIIKLLIIYLSIYFLYPNNIFCQQDDAAHLQALITRVANLEYQQNYKDAIAAQKELVEFAERIYGVESYEAADGLEKLADLYCSEKEYIKAKDPYNRALSIFNKKPERKQIVQILKMPALKYDPMIDNHIAVVLWKLGRVLSELSEFKEGEDTFKKAVTILEKEVKSSNYGNRTTAIPILGRTFDELGTIYLKQGKLKEAEDYYKKAISTVEEYLGEDSSTVTMYREHLDRVNQPKGQDKR